MTCPCFVSVFVLSTAAAWSPLFHAVPRLRLCRQTQRIVRLCLRIKDEQVGRDLQQGADVLQMDLLAVLVDLSLVPHQLAALGRQSTAGLDLDELPELGLFVIPEFTSNGSSELPHRA